MKVFKNNETLPRRTVTKVCITNKLTNHETHPYKTTVSSPIRGTRRRAVREHRFGDASQWRAFVEGVRETAHVLGVSIEEKGFHVKSDVEAH